ncbi:MAG: cation transporter [Desulfovibrionales bacterium GWA2_65_9]|nr:MAG: cation transporter [Desulfovibrionales bacterium GWA2_65_9]
MIDAPHTTDVQALKETNRAALSSVLAALLLTGLKLAAGLYTGSLGILSEAAHSGLDLVAAGVTLFAVRLSAVPPDAKHPYGHGKVENLSALAETALLLLTCVWIIYEAVDRLFFNPREVDASLWAVGVMVVSIVVDFSRSRMLLAVAKKHNSQALEADALHFSTDIWSSLVVLAGLGALALADLVAPTSVLKPWLLRADSLAALAVSGIVLWVSWRLGSQAIDVLLDAGVHEASAQIERAMLALPGVTGVRRVRVRSSGPASFVDMRLLVQPGLDADEAHQVAREARKAVRALLHDADVMVEVKPQEEGTSGLLERVRAVAARFSLSAHDIQVRQLDGGLTLDLHAEVPGSLSLIDAHDRVTVMEAALLRELGPTLSVVTHIEPEGAHPAPMPEHGEAAQALRQAIADIVEETAGVCDMHRLELHRSGARFGASFHCRMHPETPITRAHDVTVALEASLRARLPELVRVTIHMEPEILEAELPPVV